MERSRRGLPRRLPRAAGSHRCQENQTLRQSEGDDQNCCSEYVRCCACGAPGVSREKSWRLLQPLLSLQGMALKTGDSYPQARLRVIYTLTIFYLLL